MSESVEPSFFESDNFTPARGTYDTANLTGRQIGRYLIGRRLGSGGAAAVYQAYDQVQGRTVALKVLLPGADETTRSRFRQEARTAGSLRHPNIVTTLQVGDAPADGIAYIAMELIEGESLARLLERRGKLMPEESCNLLTPIARALDHAHRSGVIHRDVKPSNILLRPTSPGAPGSVQLEALDYPVVPLLSDFGIARALDTPELTNSGRTIGTPAYMAPEQCAGSRDVTPQSDIYSLGAVLYRCLVGRAPFLGSTTQILYAHVYDAVTIPDDILATLPPRAVDLLRSTLAKEPADRYASALDMADALILAAGRPLAEPGSDAYFNETTSTLTLSSISSVNPILPPQPTETVIVTSPATSTVSARRQAAIDGTQAATDIPITPTQSQPTSPQLITPPPATRFRSNRWQSLAVGAVGVVALIFMGIALISAGSGFPFERLFSQDGGATATSQPVALLATATQDAGALPAGTPPASIPSDSAPSPTPSEGASGDTSDSTPATPTVQPTATQTSAPTFTATPRPQPTQRPTPVPIIQPTTAPTPTPEDSVASACQYVAVEELYSYLRQEKNAELLGCAIDQGALISFVVQPFQNGLMLRRNDTREMYVRFAGNGQWERHPDGWSEGMPLTPPDREFAMPSPGLIQPEKGFGLLWAENSAVRGTLGWATAPATASTGIVQNFAEGLLIRDTQADSDVIYAFLRRLFRF